MMVTEKNKIYHRGTETQGNLEELNRISGLILQCSVEVHKQLGPGLLESVYEVCLVKELIAKGLKVHRQVFLPVVYKGDVLDLDFRIDLLVNDEVIVELKAIEGILPVHEAQLLTYLKIAGKRLGLLINFNEALLKSGFKRMLNGY
jgi:GxxExxY protein